MSNKILPLFDETFAKRFLEEKILPQYPSFSSISRVQVKPYKKLVWDTTYHVVIGYNVYFVDASHKEKRLSLVAVGHSEEPRENVFLALRFLWSQGLAADGIDLPRPLLYDRHFNCTFYRALSGENLLYYIKKADPAEVERIVSAAARLFARLHALPAGEKENFNPTGSRIRTVIPGTDNILQEMAARYGSKYNPDLQAIYSYLSEQEEKNLTVLPRLSLIHGDAHPENIIRTGSDRIGLIDFTDICLGDPARDLGTFCQQLEYKITTKLNDKAYAIKIRELFLADYLAAAGIGMTPALKERIDLYYNWTAIRTAVYWFLKFDPNEGRGAALLRQVKDKLSKAL